MSEKSPSDFADNADTNCAGSTAWTEDPQSAAATENEPTEAQFFIPDLEYSVEEEVTVVHILDTRLFPWILLTTFVLNMDRTNHSNAISDNLPADLGFTIDTVNTGTIIYSVVFSIFCFSGAVMSKIVNPARWIQMLIFSWGLVTMSHALITDKAGYLTVRTFIAITEGGVIPCTLVYLSGFYKNTELATRLAWFWGIQTIANAVSGLMASGLLQLGGHSGLEGWKWLFIVDGILTVVVSVVIWFNLPRNAANTALNGFKPWFDTRQVQIAVTRVIRDDMSKRSYEKRVTRADFKDAATDLGLWGHLLLTACTLTPTNPLGTYLPTVIKSFNFNVFVSNALTAPPYILQCIVMITVIRHSDTVRERGFHGAFSSGWQLVGWIILRAMPKSAPRGVKYLAVVILQSWPYNHPLNIAWMSENTGSVLHFLILLHRSLGKRTVASGAVIFAGNVYGVWASQIYRADDAPDVDFKRGNSINIAIAGFTTILWMLQKYYYRRRNRENTRRYAELSAEAQQGEDVAAEQRGNRSLRFRYTT
ncbi:MFS general substrate transporter [Mycena rosella]|uniref:MFS general substrate transporter n=1 Tax=Mycena rosella TaxID=1033263 RepID=A0AAD7M6P2_MYCRO|nr:MFS general substrate transporter [Mycena rosella]